MNQFITCEDMNFTPPLCLVWWICPSISWLLIKKLLEGCRKIPGYFRLKNVAICIHPCSLSFVYAEAPHFPQLCTRHVQVSPYTHKHTDNFVQVESFKYSYSVDSHSAEIKMAKVQTPSCLSQKMSWDQMATTVVVHCMNIKTTADGPPVHILAL